MKLSDRNHINQQTESNTRAYLNALSALPRGYANIIDGLGLSLALGLTCNGISTIGS